MKPIQWIDRFPVGLFAIPVGLLALAGAWRRANVFNWPVSQPIAQTLAWLPVLWRGDADRATTHGHTHAWASAGRDLGWSCNAVTSRRHICRNRLLLAWGCAR